MKVSLYVSLENFYLGESSSRIIQSCCQVPELFFDDLGETGKQVRWSSHTTDHSCAAPATVSKRGFIHMPLSSDTWEGDEPNLASPETGLSLNLKSIHFGDV